MGANGKGRERFYDLLGSLGETEGMVMGTKINDHSSSSGKGTMGGVGCGGRPSSPRSGRQPLLPQSQVSRCRG